LKEPALAMAVPKASDRDTDGLLTASEIAALRLKARWVILSACNTGAPAVPDFEGFSGLSQAFFYAGAESLLVSHWRVDDEATERLIASTTLLQRRGLSKAQALRQASCALRNGVATPSTKIDYCYAGGSRAVVSAEDADRFSHPAFWASFTVLGEAH
jgi:CHAT domain-containing protein